MDFAYLHILSATSNMYSAIAPHGAIVTHYVELASIGGKDGVLGDGPDRNGRDNRIAGGGDDGDGAGGVNHYVELAAIGGKDGRSGFPPTGTVATTVLLTVEMTETVPLV